LLAAVNVLMVVQIQLIYVAHNIVRTPLKLRGLTAGRVGIDATCMNHTYVAAHTPFHGARFLSIA
jgi:hypothetical protein